MDVVPLPPSLKGAPLPSSTAVANLASLDKLRQALGPEAPVPAPSAATVLAAPPVDVLKYAAQAFPSASVTALADLVAGWTEEAACVVFPRLVTPVGSAAWLDAHRTCVARLAKGIEARSPEVRLVALSSELVLHSWTVPADVALREAEDSRGHPLAQQLLTLAAAAPDLQTVAYDLACLFWSGLARRLNQPRVLRALPSLMAQFEGVAPDHEHASQMSVLVTQCRLRCVRFATLAFEAARAPPGDPPLALPGDPAPGPLPRAGEALPLAVEVLGLLTVVDCVTPQDGFLAVQVALWIERAVGDPGAAAVRSARRDAADVLSRAPADARVTCLALAQLEGKPLVDVHVEDGLLGNAGLRRMLAVFAASAAQPSRARVHVDVWRARGSLLRAADDTLAWLQASPGAYGLPGSFLERSWHLQVMDQVVEQCPFALRGRADSTGALDAASPRIAMWPWSRTLDPDDVPRAWTVAAQPASAAVTPALVSAATGGSRPQQPPSLAS